MDARLGEHSEVVQKWLRNNAPSSANRSIRGVFQVRVPHTAESIPPLVIGENEDYIWPVRLNQGCAEYNAQKKEGSVEKERNGAFVHFD